MTEIFVDAAAWIALVNSRDSLHKKAKKTLHRIQQETHKLITTEYVLLELASSLSSPDFRTQVSILIDGLIASNEVEVISCDSNLFEAAFDLYKARPDKSWSLVDCGSFVVMKRRNINDAFTQDRHFAQAGFGILL